MIEAEIEHSDQLLNTTTFFNVLSDTEKELVQNILDRKVFVTHQNNEYFFVRSGPSTLSLKLSEFNKYNQIHFT